MSLRTRAVVGLSLAVAATGFYAQPASANLAGTGLVISEVYGGGGNTGATYTNDFIELYNPTAAAISVEGKSVQYRSATGAGAGAVTRALRDPSPRAGTTWSRRPPARPARTALPTPDATGNTAIAGGGGQVWLADTTAALTPPSGNVQPAGHHRLRRREQHCHVVRDGQADHGARQRHLGVAQRQRRGHRQQHRRLHGRTAHPDELRHRHPAAAGRRSPPPSPRSRAPARRSPLAGKTATTRGVVTAAYPTGGFNGFYIQTARRHHATTPPTRSSSSAAPPTATAHDRRLRRGRRTGQGVRRHHRARDRLRAATSPCSAKPRRRSRRSPSPLPATEAGREATRASCSLPTGGFTVTNTFSTNQFAEIGLAAGDKPLIQPTDVADAQDKPAIDAITADNAARAVTLDDGASLNFLSAANQGIALPWLSKANPVRVGAAGDLPRSRGAGVPQQRLEVPADHPRGDRRAPRRPRSRTPAPRRPRTWAATCAWRRSTC